MNSVMSVAAKKKELRRKLLSVLNAYPPEARQAADEEIRRRVAELPQFQQAERLFIFVGDGWEVDTWPLIEAALTAGKQVAVPRCIPIASGMPGVMEACLIQSRRDLRQTQPLGLWEPAEGTPVLSPAMIDFALIPCVACDKAGMRLGRGGGYYDRFLAAGGFTKAAVCRQALLQEELPVEAHDQRVDYIITEAGLYATRSPINNKESGNYHGKSVFGV